MPNNLREFLQPTRFCDCGNPNITKLSNRLIAGAKTERAKAVAIFSYVKNNYKYGFGRWDFKASEMIGRRRGMCTTKANLLVACLRAQGIPAGFKIIEIKAREVFSRFTVFRSITDKISERSIHIYASAYLDNKWLDIDPSLDQPLVKGIIKYGYSAEGLQAWNGRDNYLNFIPADKVIQERGFFSNIDDYHLKSRKTAKRFFLLATGLIMDYYRLRGAFLK